jgi:hypothetical protein
MRVKLCALCPYSVRDVAEHYDSRAEHALCATCPTKPLPMAPKYKRERRQWACAMKEVPSVSAQPMA